MPERLKEYHQLVTGNIIFQNRLKGVGVLSKEDAVNYGVAGPSGRASGWACDLRKTNPYSIYSELDFEQVVLDGCDSFDRYLVRLKEIEQSCKILEQLVDNIPEETIALRCRRLSSFRKDIGIRKLRHAEAFSVFISTARARSRLTA